MKPRPFLRHLLAVMAKVADFGCWLPSVNLNQVFSLRSLHTGQSLTRHQGSHIWQIFFGNLFAIASGFL
jgi:hypothetical protein